MENASKALLMAGGILLGVLILALMVTLFTSTSSLSTSYENTKQEEMVQKFNSNFTQYIGKDITIHDVVTICNFARVENNKVKDVVIDGTQYDKGQIAIDLKDINNKYKAGVADGEKVEIFYTIAIKDYDDNGYVSKISFGSREMKTY